MRKLHSGQFLGLKAKSFGEADIIIQPIPYEKTVTYGKGTKSAPRAIIDASLELEYFDEECIIELSEYHNFITEKFLLDQENQSITGFINSAIRQLSKLKGKFVISIGGEHTITYPLVVSLTDNLTETTIVQIDAHCDLLDRQHSLKFAHGTVMKRLMDKGCSLVQIGIRSCSKEEFRFLQSNDKCTTYFAHKMHDEWQDIIGTLRNLKGNIYLTIDVDGIDPSVIPSTGTPQPNGLNWNMLMEVIKTVSENQQSNFIGCDLVEYIACPHPPMYDIIAAKIITKILAFYIKNRSSSTKGH